MAFFAYNLLITLLSPITIAYFLWRVFVSRKASLSWRENLGELPLLADRPEGSKLIWIHAASVGEVVAFSPVKDEIHRLVPGCTVLVTTITETGNAMAKKLAKDGDVVAFLPIDYLFIVRRAFNRVRPDIFGTVEAEIWPNLLSEAKRRGARTFLVNGRISDHGYREFRVWGWLLSWAFSNFDHCCMQTEQDVSRVSKMGARSSAISLMGNTKFDQENARISDAAAQALKSSLGIPEGAKSIVAGSTNKGEEEIILSAFREMRKEIPDLRLVIAPRQIDRAEDIRRLIENSFGLRSVKRSSGTAEKGFDVLILDTFGELASTYAVAEVAFVGGTLIKKGGHSIVQPILQGKPVLFGPHIFKTRDIARMSIDAGIGFIVNDAHELSRKGLELLRSDKCRLSICDACMEMVASNHGASARCAEMMAELLAARKEGANAV